jgi:ATP-dependent RNA helicase DHX57
MAASMSVGRSPFLRIEPTRRQASCDGGDLTIDEMKQKRVTEERAALAKTVGNSDHALIAAAYLQWDAAGLGTGERKRFCDLLGLSFNGMREMKLLVQQLSDSLSSVGFFASEEADCNIKSWRVIRTTAVASLAPSQIVRVQRPGAKYAETAEGAMEKDGVAKELKFFIRSQSDGGQADSSPQNLKGYHGVNEERVFLHPASINFSVGSFSCPWLVYHELVQTSKAFVRDSTECSTYALLLFGGKLKVQADKNSIVIGDWVQFSAVGRIGALIGGLRRKVDELLLRKIDNPSFDIAQTTEMRLIVKLLSRDGLH